MLLIIRTIFISSGLFSIINDQTTVLDFNLVSINSVEFNYIIIVDYISLVFMGVVTIIAGCVVFYRKDYMAGDININRFI